MTQRGGFAILPQRMLHDKDIPQSAKMTYLALSSFVGEREEVWPSHKTLAELTGSSVSSVQRSLKWLKDAGWITWRPGKDDSTGGQTSNRYVVHTHPTPPVTVTDPPGQADRRTRTNEQEPTTKDVVESSLGENTAEVPSTPVSSTNSTGVATEVPLNRLAYGHTWTPNQVAVDAVFNSARANSFIYPPDEHLDHYLSRMSELNRKPTSAEWPRWFGQDQAKRLAEERSMKRTEEPETDDTGTPLSWKGKS